jgi:hypothetical protein
MAGTVRALYSYLAKQRGHPLGWTIALFAEDGWKEAHVAHATAREHMVPGGLALSPYR